MMLLDIKKARKYFPVKKEIWGRAGTFVKAVDSIDLSLRQGENLSLVGESGSGKSTLAKLILRLMPLDSGSISFEGRDISKMNKPALQLMRKNMQMVFQDPHGSLDPRFSISHIMREAMHLNRELNNKEKEKKSRKLLEAVNLSEDVLDRYPHEFSGGERQRIAIARALCLNPKLLILDEAVSSLDVIIQEQLIHLLIELQKKYHLTYFFISHNLRVVKKISQRIAVMYKGKIVELGAAEEIFNNPIHPYTRDLLSAAIHYQSSGRADEYQINSGAELKDQGNGHYVID